MTQKKIDDERQINAKRILPTLFGMPMAEATLAWQLENLSDLNAYLFQHVIEHTSDDNTKEVFKKAADAGFIDGVAFTRVDGAQVPVKFTFVYGLGSIDETRIERAIDSAVKLLNEDFGLANFKYEMLGIGEKFQDTYQQLKLPALQVQIDVEAGAALLFTASQVEHWFNDDQWFKAANKKLNK